MMKDRELAREGDRFVAEGEYIVRRLLASDYPCESVLVVERLAEENRRRHPAQASALYVTTNALLREIIGFKFHSGVMAVGAAQARPHHCRLARASKPKRATLVVCPDLIGVQNMGSLVRICAAPRCRWHAPRREMLRPPSGDNPSASPWQCVLPPHRPIDEPLRRPESPPPPAASTWSPPSSTEMPNPSTAYPRAQPPSPSCSENENNGLKPRPSSAACHRRVTIPMREGHRLPQCPPSPRESFSITSHEPTH